MTEALGRDLYERTEGARGHRNGYKLKDELFQAFFPRIHDHKLAETLTAGLIEAAGVREI